MFQMNRKYEVQMNRYTPPVPIGVFATLSPYVILCIKRINVGKYLCDDEEENAVGALSRHRNERQDKVYSK